MSTTSEDRVRKVIAEQLGIDYDHVTPDKSLVADLGADSLDQVELVMAFEDEFGIEIDDETAEKVVTVRDTVALVCIAARSNIQ